MNASVTIENSDIFLEVSPNVTIPQSAVTNLVSDLALKVNSTGLVASATISSSATLSSSANYIAWSSIAGRPTTSSELASLISNVTGTGSVVFSISPALTTPSIGAATGISLALSGTASVVSHASVGGNLVVDGSTFFVDSVQNRVGIGTLSPTASLHVVGNVEVQGTVNATSLTATNGISAASATTLYTSGSITRVWAASAVVPVTSGSGTVNITLPDINAGGAGNGWPQSSRIFTTVTEIDPSSYPRFLFSVTRGQSSLEIRALNIVNTGSNDDCNVNIIVASVE